MCAAERLWLHVDGAYGAVGAVAPVCRARYDGLERADSLALDPHKWFSVPVECGAALVRDGRLLRDAFSLVPAYLRTGSRRGFGGLPWFSEYGPQQTRGFRALKLWMTIRRSAAMACARWSSAIWRSPALAGLVDAAPDLERLGQGQLSIVCFRYAPASLKGDDRALDALNKAVMEEVQASGAAFLTQTTLARPLRAARVHPALRDDGIGPRGARRVRVRTTGARFVGMARPLYPPAEGGASSRGRVIHLKRIATPIELSDRTPRRRSRSSSSTRRSICGPNRLLDADGASLVVHERADDYVTDPAGNAGARIASASITTRARRALKRAPPRVENEPSRRGIVGTWRTRADWEAWHRPGRGSARSFPPRDTCALIV